MKPKKTVFVSGGLTVMNSQEFLLTLCSCVFFMLLVASVSYRQSKGKLATREGYFLAGRGLNAVFIAGSMILTNLSANHLIGLNGSAYGFNMSSMGWEVTAAFATICMAFIFLPKYLSGAFSTLPEFLNERFDPSVRRLSVVLFMLGYGLVTIPSVLYAGSVAVLQLFDIPTQLGMSYELSLTLTIIVVGSIGGMYAVFGGLRAVAVSDTLNGIGLLIVGIIVPILGFSLLGEGNFWDGVKTVTTNDTYKLNAIGSSSDPTPFPTLFTGMIFANLFYWCTNQYVIQRTLAARNLAEGQKGVLFSGFFKVLVPFLMMLPGIIAYHLYGPTLASIDLAYPALIRDVLPEYAMGFFLAVLLGAVFSSFNSLLNSAATLFCLDVYLPFKNGAVDDATLVRVAKITSVLIAIISFFIAPLLQFAPEGLWQIMRIFTGFYNIPIIAIVLVGLFTRHVPSIGPKFVIGFHLVAYTLLQFVFNEAIDIHFLHLYGVLFVMEVSIMLTIGHFYPQGSLYSFKPRQRVDMTPWEFAPACAITLMSTVFAVYMLFSPLGLVDGIGDWFMPLLSLIGLVNSVVWVRAVRYSTYAQALRKNI